MSSTSQLTTFSDLYTDLLNRVRVTPGVTATDTIAKRYINIALQDIHLGFDYKLPWCERTAVLRTHAPYTTGTLSATVGSTTITGASTAWTTANSYGEINVNSKGKLLIAGDTNVYKVASADGGLQLTLETKYVGSADVTDSTYTYFEDEYRLTTNFLRPIDYQMFSQQVNLPLISRSEFRRRYPVTTVGGRPRVACLVDTELTSAIKTPARKVLLYPYPDQVYLIPYTYVTSTVAVTSAGAELTSMSSDTDAPTMPLRYRHVILLHALAHWYRDRKDDARADAAQAEYSGMMERIVGDHDIATHTTAQLQPRGGYYRAARNPYSSRAGRRIYDLNNEFDSFRR